MKIDRLIGLTMYLLNRDIVSSKELAERFEVSKRTIVRDIETLCMAGIPITSSTGASGGYEILDTFKLNKQITTVDDYLLIITALKGLCSAYDNQRINNTLEKLLATGPYTAEQQRVYIDFGVIKEGENIPRYVQEIEKAIQENRILSFAYTDSTGRQNHRKVEPLALNYRWYAWYLLGYCTYKNDYRFFKLNRISGLTLTDEPCTQKHENIPALLEKQWSSDTRSVYKIKLLCKAEARVPAAEYLKGKIMEEYENGDFVMEIEGYENERMWFSLLLGFGAQVKVLEPQEIVDQLLEKSAEIQKLYKS